MSRDAEHLDLLAIFHYVVAGLTALGSLVPLIHLTIGIGMVSGRMAGDEPMTREIGLFFIFIASVLIVMGLTFAVFVVFAGRALQRRRNYMFCLVIAGLLCVVMPFGTVLGVFTIIVLMRDSVRQLFGVDSAEPAAAAG